MVRHSSASQTSRQALTPHLWPQESGILHGSDYAASSERRYKDAAIDVTYSVSEVIPPEDILCSEYGCGEAGEGRQKWTRVLKRPRCR